MSGVKQTRLDPLFIIFEEHLLNSQGIGLNRKSFAEAVVADYLKHLRNMNISVPQSLEKSIFEELSSQVEVMLIKKTYGYSSLQDYQRKLKPAEKKKAHARYVQLAKKKISV